MFRHPRLRIQQTKRPACVYKNPRIPSFYSVSLSGNTINTSSQPTMDLKNCYRLTCTAGLAVAAAGRIAPENPFIEWRFVVQCRQLVRRIAVRLDVCTSRRPRRQIGVHGPPRSGLRAAPPRNAAAFAGSRSGSGSGSGRGGRMWRAHVCGGGETARYVPPPSCTCCQLILLQSPDDTLSGTLSFFFSSS